MAELSASSERISTGFQKPSWPSHRRDLFNAHIPKKLPKSIRGNATSDKKDEFAQERLFRIVSKRNTRNAFGEIS